MHDVEKIRRHRSRIFQWLTLDAKKYGSLVVQNLTPECATLRSKADFYTSRN